MKRAFQNSNEKLEKVNSSLEMSAFVRGRVIKIIEREASFSFFLTKVVSFFQGLLFSAAGCSSNVHLKDISLQNKLEMQNFEKKLKKEKDGKLQRRLSEKKKYYFVVSTLLLLCLLTLKRKTVQWSLMDTYYHYRLIIFIYIHLPINPMKGFQSRYFCINDWFWIGA